MMAYGNAVRRNFPGMGRYCSTCDETFIITEAMCRGRRYRCPVCDSKKAVQWAKDNREKKRTANNAYSSRTSSQRAERTRAYRDRFPEKKAAWQAVQTALRNGSLTKRPCEICGAIDAHAHHEDYERPLSINWLCHAHHMEHHLMLKARANGEAG